MLRRGFIIDTNILVSAQAEAIVTQNIRDFKGVEKFGINVLTPKEFLQRIGEIT